MNDPDLKLEQVKHRMWLGNHPGATLGDLLAHLRRVKEELGGFNEEESLASLALSAETTDYLKVFGDGPEVTVSWRLDNVEEDIDHVEDLIDTLGDDCQVR
jgi:hypothetical protein